jgi:transposase
MLPKDFPKWQLVYSYFRQWIKKRKKSEASLLEQALKKSDHQFSYLVRQKGKNYFSDNRFTKREKHRSS